MVNHKNRPKILAALGVDDRLMARLDTHLIEQALVNLLDNAVKYSPENTSILISLGTEFIYPRVLLNPLRNDEC